MEKSHLMVDLIGSSPGCKAAKVRLAVMPVSIRGSLENRIAFADITALGFLDAR
jgi:hypothetical protein